MRLLVTRPMTETAVTMIAAGFDADFRDSNTPLTEAEIARALRDYDAILPTLGDRFTAQALAGEGLRTRIIANFGAGYDHIDVAAARAAGVVVTNTPDVVTEATADLAMMLVLMAARRASEGERLLRAGQWTGWHPTQLLGTNVGGKVLGVIGMGRIGRAIARRAHHGFGMPVVFHNRSIVSSLDVPARQMPSLEETLEAADFAVIAVPGGAATRGLIGARELARLGRDSILVNIARGDVVDEDALIAALRERRIRGAGLDVYAREPVVPEALRALDNVTLLPHLGTATEEARTNMALRALDNLRAFFDGQPPPDLVA